MNEFRTTLEQALQLASGGKLKQAISLLEEGVRAARRGKDDKYITLLYRNAGLLSDKSGDFPRAVYHYRISFKHGGQDPYICYSLGELYERMGKRASARRYFNLSYDLATRKGEKDLLEILTKRGYRAPKRRVLQA